MSAFREPVASRPSSSRMHRDSARSERSPQSTSFPVYPSHDQRESKRFSSLSAKTLSPNSPISRESSKILFYHSHDPYYGFTNFSSHPVVYRGKKYPTSEHLFQSFKFQDHKPDLAEHIRTCSERPSVAFSEARRFQPEVRPDWKEVNIPMMDIVLQLKFEQHDDLREELLGTGNASLFEDSDKDAFWGVGPDRKGRNELGKALERIRTKLRASNYGLMSPTHNAQSTLTSLASNAALKTDSLVPKAQPPNVNNVQSPTLHSTQLSSNRNTRFQVLPTHPLVQNTVQSPTHTSPYPGHNVQIPGYASQTRVPPVRHAVQTTQSLTQNRKDPTHNAHLTMQNIQSPIPELQVAEQNRPLTEQNAESNNHSPKSLNYDSVETVPTAPADLAVKCRIPDCEKPVYYDGMVKSDYCSQQHRQEAVTRGLAVACIKCLKMPQSETDFFCGRGCRDESLVKTRSKI